MIFVIVLLILALSGQQGITPGDWTIAEPTETTINAKFVGFKYESDVKKAYDIAMDCSKGQLMNVCLSDSGYEYDIEHNVIKRKVKHSGINKKEQAFNGVPFKL
jgi:hypothetical protein